MIRIAALADALMTLALIAWVGGHAALGAFAARIVFRELPREQAAPTMTAVFRSFDKLMLVAVIVVAACALVRGWALRLAALRGTPSPAAQGRSAGWPVLLAAAALVALGAFQLAYVHPTIEQMFESGRTLEPAFAAMHKISERCAHLEVLLTIFLVAAQAFQRAAR